MSLVTFSEVTRFYANQDVLKDVSFSINFAEKIGLVGRNGAGKTTIMRLLTGLESPDSGLINKSKSLRIGYLPQEILLEGSRTLIELVLDVDQEYRDVENELAEIEEEISKIGDSPELLELVSRQSRLLEVFDSLGGWSKEADAKKILSGLGFQEKDFNRDLSEFSGGWAMRAILARLLFASPDLLILDEPTNHLDMDSMLWLENYLKNSTASLLMVSHDRIFLNNIVNKVVEIRQGKAYTYQGNYDLYEAEKILRLSQENAAFKNQQERIKEIEKFIDKNKSRASTAKLAQSRVKMLAKMEIIQAPDKPDPKSFSFKLPQPSRGSEVVAELGHVSKNYNSLSIYKDLNLVLRRGERLALVGPNGRGKSTLLKILAGLESFEKGERRIGQGVQIGYFAQFQIDALNPNNTIIEELSTAGSNLEQVKLRSILGSFLFIGEDVFKKVSVLSGGEKSRLALAKIMLLAPNLLLMDEPTNHLDMPGRQMLLDALSDYTGTMVLISHDRYFINNLCEHTGLIENGELTVYPGNFDDYQNIWQPTTVAQQESNNDKTEAKASKNRFVDKKAEALRRNELSAQKKSLKAVITQSESAMEKLYTRRDEIHNLLSNPDTYKDSAKVVEYSTELSEINIKLEEHEHQWQQASLELEALV